MQWGGLKVKGKPQISGPPCTQTQLHVGRWTVGVRCIARHAHPQGMIQPCVGWSFLAELGKPMFTLLQRTRVVSNLDRCPCARAVLVQTHFEVFQVAADLDGYKLEHLRTTPP